MTARHKQSLRIITRKNTWHETIKCTVIMKAILVFMIACIPAQAAENSTAPTAAKVQAPSSASVSSCKPPQDTCMDKGKTAVRTQRKAGTPPMSSAMVLSLAFGLRTATGPLVRSDKTALTISSPAPKKSGLNTVAGNRTALADPLFTVTKRAGLFGKGSYQRLAMEK